MESDKKRKADSIDNEHHGKSSFKKKKINKAWKKSYHNATSKDTNRPKQVRQEAAKIEPGDSGIWATCDKGREAKCVSELRDLLQEFAEGVYTEQLETEVNFDSANGNEVQDETAENMQSSNDSVQDIEKQILAEVKAIKIPTFKPLFTNVWIDMQCVIFLKTRPPVEPATFVSDLCRNLMEGGRPKTRYAKRLTPITLVGRATEEGLEEVARKVLHPHFHSSNQVSRSFAIRPSIRNSSKTLTRETIIRRVAGIVGSPHRVDLTNPDLVVLIEVYKLHIGMSVVDGDYESLKRFNLAEIYDSSSSSSAKNNKDFETVDRS